MSQHVVVLGAGAMGSLFGGLLAEGGLKVTLLDPWQEHIERIQKDGLKMVGFGGDRFIPIGATSHPADVGSADIVFVQCKANFNAAAAKSVQHLFTADTNTVAISFQNGLGNEEELAEYFGEDRVLGGLTAQGANVEGPGVIRNHAELPSYIGEMSGGVSQRTTEIAKMLSSAGLPTEPSEHIRLDIWRKLMANIAISAASGITGLNIGQIFNQHLADDVSYAALDEAVAVANAAGVKLSADEAREILAKIAGPNGTPGNKSSLRVDIENERPSEIDYINGAVVTLGKKHGVPVPVNQTLVTLVHALQAHYLKTGSAG
ncbi:MAG: ketopantoate reductase family protein [Woeseiaceae bacterium]